MADLIKTPSHADPLQGKNQEHVEKIILAIVFLFEGMDILAGLMGNQSCWNRDAIMAIKT